MFPKHLKVFSPSYYNLAKADHYLSGRSQLPFKPFSSRYGGKNKEVSIYLHLYFYITVGHEKKMSKSKRSKSHMPSDKENTLKKGCTDYFKIQELQLVSGVITII